MTFDLLRTILGVKTQKYFFLRINDNFSFGYFMTPMTLF